MEVRHVEQCAAETMDLQVVAEQLTCGEGLAQAGNSRFDQDVPATDVDAAVAEQLGQLVKVAGLRGENRDAQLGCEAASLSCVTNKATGLSPTPLAHSEVTEVADRVAVKLRAVLESFLDAGA